MRAACLIAVLLAALTLAPSPAPCQNPADAPGPESAPPDAVIEAEIMDEMRWLQEEAFDMEVTTVSKKAQKISEAPATVISIGQDQIRAFGWRDLKDIFRALPGFDVSHYVQGEQKTQVIMRGVIGNQKILILQDGQRQSAASGEQFLYGRNVPLHPYKRIEIIYGPASSVYGADAYAGVINLITHDGADYDGVSASGGWIFSDTADAWTADLTFGKAFGDDVDALLSARIYRGEDQKLHEDYPEYDAVNHYAGELGELDNSYPVKNWNMLMKLRYKRFTLGFDWQRELETNAGVSLPDRYGYVKDAVWGQDLRHAYLTHRAFEGEKLRVTATVSAGDYQLNTATNFYIVQKDANGNMIDGAPAYKYAESSWLKGEIQAAWDAFDRFSIVSGVSYEYVESFPKTRNLANPFNADGDLEVDYSDFTDPNGYTFGIIGFREPVFRERDYYNVGLYAQAEYVFSDYLKIDAGLRYDYNSEYSETINPRAGLIITPLTGLTIKLLYGTAYIQPTNYYRYENFANPYIMHIPNEDLAPEELTNYSLDITYALARNFLVRGSLYYNKMENIIRPVEAPAQADGYPYYNPYRDTPGFVEYNGNKGEIISKGGEVSVSHSIGGLTSALSYAYVTGEDEGFDISQISEHKLILNTRYSAERWTAGLTLRYYGEVNVDRDNYKYGDAEAGGDESYGFDGDLVAFLNLIYHVTDRLDAQATVDNLFNSRHYAGSPFDGSPVVAPRAPQPLREVYLGLRYAF